MALGKKKRVNKPREKTSSWAYVTGELQIDKRKSREPGIQNSQLKGVKLELELQRREMRKELPLKKYR
jgi:hypothetical protein